MSRSLPWFYYVANRLFRIILPIANVHVTVKGRENVPLHGPLIVTFNHQIFLDPPLIGAFLPRDIEMMSKIENFESNPILGWVVRNYGAFPIRRGEADISAMRHALQVLKEGRALLMSPEGTRSRNGQLGEPQPGVVAIALRSGAPVLPVGIAGAEQFLGNIRRWRRTSVTITIGQPFYLVSPTPKSDRAMLLEMGDAIMERIALQLPPSYRGRFNQPRHAALTRDSAPQTLSA